MKKLIALIVGVLAAIGAATVVFWRKNHRQSWDSSLSSVKDSASSWGKTATDQAGRAADRVSGVADDVSDAASHAADEVKNQLGRES
jgi:hypothetical protein